MMIHLFPGGDVFIVTYLFSNTNNINWIELNWIDSLNTYKTKVLIYIRLLIGTSMIIIANYWYILPVHQKYHFYSSRLCCWTMKSLNADFATPFAGTMWPPGCHTTTVPALATTLPSFASPTPSRSVEVGCKVTPSRSVEVGCKVAPSRSVEVGCKVATNARLRRAGMISSAVPKQWRMRGPVSLVVGHGCSVRACRW